MGLGVGDEPVFNCLGRSVSMGGAAVTLERALNATPGKKTSSY